MSLRFMVVVCCSHQSERYSIMLTKIEFMKSEYLFWYSCAFDRRVLQWIREHKNCEDIAMQMVSYF